LRRGIVYKLDNSGNESVVYNFCSQSNPNQDCTDGADPFGGLVLDPAGNLYGTTANGGAVGFGTVFKLNPATGVETVLYSFSGLSTGDGAKPQSTLWRDGGGNLYGTTPSGGQACSLSGAGCGTVFSVDSTGKETVLHRFSGGSDGGLPDAGVVYNAQFLYGTTPFGGASGKGVVFVLGAGGGTELVLHSFGNLPDGAYPFSGGLLNIGSVLYGATSSGGLNGMGAIFRLKSVGGKWKYKVLASLGNQVGAEPGYGGLIKIGKYLYTTTISGGSFQQGTIIRIDPKGNIKVLYSFTGGNDGAQPQGSLLSTNGFLYGTTFNAGQFQGGTAFWLLP
jgi:uncharacterized repeat protein (TIGR03803 family)